MSANPRTPEDARRRRRRRFLAVAAVLLVVVLAAVGLRLRQRRALPLTDIRVLIVLTMRQEDGGRAADVAAYARLAPGSTAIRALLVPAALRVEVPGVTDDRLREVYAFGGSALVAEAFAKSTGLPVDAAIAIDEPDLRRLLEPLAPIDIVLNQPIEVFRQDRYTGFGDESRTALKAVETIDLLAASGSAGIETDQEQVPGADVGRARDADMVLQGRLAAAILRAVSRSGGGLPIVQGADVWTKPGLGPLLQGVAMDSGWPRVKLARAAGRFVVREGRLYWQPQKPSLASLYPARP